MKRLWAERSNGGGDVEIEVNGEITTAHWCLLKDVPYFQQLKSKQAPQTDKIKYLKIEDSSISSRSLIEAMEYVYSDYCFTDSLCPTEFHSFSQFVEKKTLAVQSLKQAIQSITQVSCVDYFKLGKAYQLAPLSQKAWRKAIDSQWLPEIEQMIAFRLDLNTPLTVQQQTALHISLGRGYLPLAQMLITAGAKVNTADQKGTTPLGLAVWDGHTHLSELLLNSGADINTTDQWGQTALHKACAKGLEKVVHLLLDYGADVNRTCRSGYTPLHIAAIGGHEKVVLMLLKHGAVWKEADVPWLKTALHMAAMKGHKHLVDILLTLDNKQVRETIECLTPLHTAVKFGYYDVVKALLDHGVSANVQDWDGRTPLHYAAKSGNTEVLQLLINAGGALYSQDKYKMTCLHLAAKTRHSNSVSLLVKQKNCPLNVVDKYGLTALHYAAESRNTKMVRQLLTAGAVPSILSNDGKIARNLRGKKKHLDTLKFLIMARS